MDDPMQFCIPVDSEAPLGRQGEAASALKLALLLCLAVPAVCSGQSSGPQLFPLETAIVGDAAAPQAAGLPGQPPPDSAPQKKASTAGNCLEPAPLLSWKDYQGPFQKVVGVFAGKLEIKAAHPPRYKPGTVLCSLKASDKFTLFVRDTIDPISFLEAGFNAGLDQASSRDPTFGQGAQGYGKRFGAEFAGQTTWRFFTDFAYPTIFSEDPRYYRLSQGSGRQRFFHALEHTFVGQRDSGKHMFNISQWLGTVTAVALNDVYHPGNERGLTPALRTSGYALATGMGFDVLREFWPDIAHKLRMPFRDTRDQPATESAHPPQ